MADIDRNCVEGNCFAMNDKSHGSGDTTLNIVYKANYTGQICSAKFRIKSKDGSIVKEYMISQEARPVFYNIQMTQAFTKDDCLANQHGSVVVYTVPERRYQSFISQEDADAKALADINANGQAYANEHGECITDIWYNEEMSKVFYRNNCDEFCDGQPYTYVVPEGKYVSSISQADANNKALADIEANGQQFANINGECKEKENIFHGHYSETFTKDNCGSTEYGTEVVVDETMVEGDFRSIVSQEDADSKAEAAVKAQGQDVANIKGSCEPIPVYTGSYSKVFRRTNCPAGSTPLDFTVNERMCEGYPFTSTESQEKANELAQAAVEEQGQAIANEQGDCATNLYYNVRMEKTVNRNNCDAFSDGQPYTYVVSAGKYSSTISQEDADNKAKEDLEANAQQQANVNGECKPKENIYYGKFSMEFTRNNCSGSQYGTKVTVDETMVTGDFRSVESQEAANALAEAAVRAQGQDIANIKGTCEDSPVYTGKYSQEFTRDNCEEGGVPGTYVVTEMMCSGNPFTSTVSQDEADRKAQDAVKEQGQEIANRNAVCTFTGHASMKFTKNDCPSNQNGTEVEVTEEDVTGGPFTSTVSQSDANTVAMLAVQAQGQEVANAKGECVDKQSYTGVASFEFTKNDCPEHQVGNPYTVTQDMVEGAPFISYNSQEEANLLALAAVMNQGQAVANENGSCREADKYTGHYSEVFTKDDCPGGLIPSKVTVTEADVTGGPFYSYESQNAADELAKAAVQEQGQAIANDRGTCDEMQVYFGSYSAEFTPECPDCQYADPVTLTPDIMGQVFMSTTSQEEADAQAKAYVDRMGQAFVNKNYGDTCHAIEEQPEWETKEEVCRDCISQLRQENVNECYTGEQQERYIPGGSMTCYWLGVAQMEFTTQCADGGVGSVETVTQDECVDSVESPEGKFKSCVSQEEANALALAAVQEQGQAIANAKGTCTWQGHYEGQVQKNNCADGGVGDMVNVNSDNLSGYPYESNVSLEDANSKAEEDVRGLPGQEYANKNGGCTWTYEATRTFYPSCVENGEGQAIEVTSTQANGGTPVTSTVSLADAMDKAEQALDAGGQDYANAHGTCVWTGTGSANFTRTGCGTCYTGSTVNVPYASLGLPEITSTVSQADANSKVQQAFNSDPTVREAAQAYANKNGVCNPMDDTPSYGGWEYYCSGGNSYRRRYQSNDCAPGGAGYESEFYEDCDYGCDSSSGRCISCDPSYSCGSAQCRNGQSQRQCTNGCGDSYWEDYGQACCNTNSYEAGTATASGCECPGEGVSYAAVPRNSICRSTTNEANSAATAQHNSLYLAAQSQAECGQVYWNEYVWDEKTKQGCPSNCTAPTYGEADGCYWSAGGNGGAFRACSQAEATQMARDNLAQLCQERANQLECDCPPEASWSASAEFDESRTFPGVSSCAYNIYYTVRYNNSCTSNKTMTVYASGTICLSSGSREETVSKQVSIPPTGGATQTMSGSISVQDGFEKGVQVYSEGGGKC